MTLDDFGGDESVVAELRAVARHLVEPTAFLSSGSRAPRGVLLYGPRGAGKKFLVEALAAEAGASLVPLSLPLAADEAVGESDVASISRQFDAATRRTPAVIFIDDVERVGHTEATSEVSAGEDLTQIVSAMDCLPEGLPILVVATSSRPDKIHRLLLAPGRFDRHIQVTAPSA